MDNHLETLGDGESRLLRILADGDYSQSGGGPDRRVRKYNQGNCFADARVER